MAREGLPFPVEEYRDRFRRVREEMARRGLDLLYVTSPHNLYYLLNYESIWYYFRNPTGLAIPAEGDGFLLFDSDNHAPAVLASTIVEEGSAFFYRRRVYGEMVEAVARALAERGWLRGTVGLEFWAQAPSALVLQALGERMASYGARVVDGSWLVDRVRLVKSPRELEYVRRAAAIAMDTMEHLRRTLKAGMTELEVAGEIYHYMMKQGGEEPAIRMMVHSGPRSAHYHGPSTRRRIQPGEVVMVDYCAVYNRYHADIARPFCVGEPPPLAREVMRRSAGSLERVLQRARPGMPMREVIQVAYDHVRDQGLEPYVWWVGGYALGTHMPPDWVGHIYLGPETVEPADFLPGVVTNYENIFEVREQGFGCGYIDTILMTERGLEVLTPYPRDVIVV